MTLPAQHKQAWYLAGVLFVGVDNAGEPVGLEITDQLLKNLASMRSDGNIVPFSSLDLQKRVLKRRDVAVVVVHPSAAPPVRFKGAVWIRSGPRKGIANADDERRLNEKRRHRDLPSDIRPFASAGLDQLDGWRRKRENRCSFLNPPTAHWALTLTP